MTSLFFRLTILSTLILAQAVGAGKSVRLIVENPGDFERSRETISVPLGDLQKRFGNEAPERLMVLDAKTKSVLLSQITSDEFLFQSDFKSRARKDFLITLSQQEVGKPQSLVDGRFELPREDYAWENDRIAFRVYGPALAAEVNNGIDVWTKRVRYLIVDKWYSASAAAGKDTYHEDHGEGADFFSVRRSLGAGGSGLWINGSVRQPGVFSAQKTICNGPLRVMFELTYEWDINGKKLTERKRISLDAGQNLNRVDVSFEGLGKDDSLPVACGLVNRPNSSVSTDEDNGVMSLWGPTNSDSVNGYLGTGIVLQRSAFVVCFKDTDQYFMIAQLDKSARLIYFAGAGWTKGGDFASEKDWRTYLGMFSRRIQTPLKLLLETN